MSIYKRVLGHVYFVYALLLFFVTLCIVVWPVIIINIVHKSNEVKRIQHIHTTYVIWMRIYMTLIGCKVTVSGQEHFKKGENYVIIMNHNSFADVPISTPWIPGPNKTLAKIELMKVPIFNLIYKSGSILLDRKSEQSKVQSFQQMLQTLNDGIHLALYPEGTRNKTNKPLQAFQNGAFKTALMAKKHIIPAVLFNTKALLPDSPKCWAWPQHIRFDFLEPIDIYQYQNNELSKLKQDAFQIMESYIVAKKKYQHESEK